MNRYSLESSSFVKDDPDGEWVSYSDHVEAMKRIAGDTTPPIVAGFVRVYDEVNGPIPAEPSATSRQASTAEWLSGKSVIAQAAPSASATGGDVAAGHFQYTEGRGWTEVQKQYAGEPGVVVLYHEKGWPARQSSASAQQAPVDLTGLADRLLAPREIVRDEYGHLFNPAFPVLDEGDNVRMFLGAFGIDCCQVSMESDCDDEALRDAVWAGEKGCGEWTPTPPEGEGWLLSDIFDTEDGPYALFIRRKPPEPKKSRRERYAAPAPSASPAALTDEQIREISREYWDTDGFISYQDQISFARAILAMSASREGA